MSQDLARRAVACPRWPAKRREGFYMAHRGRLTCRELDTGRLWVDVAPGDAEAHDWLPDLDDPATVGCLEALVQAALGHDGVNIIVEPRWGVGVGYRVTRWTRSAIDSYQPMTIGGMGHATKAAALVAALEAV